MAVLVVFHVGPGGDQWLRDQIRATHDAAPIVEQRVIVEDDREAMLLHGRLSRLKHAKGLPFGGSYATGWQKGQAV